MSTQPAVRSEVRPADVERWLAELGIRPLERADREAVTSWDLVLDGRRRFDLRVTLILDSALGLIVWGHLAPPIGDRFRASYRRLLRWNDELPFIKFALAEDERPIVTTELPIDGLDGDTLGLALARLARVADHVLEDSAEWLWPRGEMPAGYASRRSRNEDLLARHEDRLGELAG
jgi:hypothetical protein